MHALGLHCCTVAPPRDPDSHIQAPSSWDYLFSAGIDTLIGCLRFEFVAQTDPHWIDVSTFGFSNVTRGKQHLCLAFG